jgi:hypothetical protein
MKNAINTYIAERNRAAAVFSQSKRTDADVVALHDAEHKAHYRFTAACAKLGANPHEVSNLATTGATLFKLGLRVV